MTMNLCSTKYEHHKWFYTTFWLLHNSVPATSYIEGEELKTSIAILVLPHPQSLFIVTRIHEENQDNLDKRPEPDNLTKEFESPAAQLFYRE
jgi:hypothetical protein